MCINSPVGMVTSGLAIYDTMQFVRPPVSTLCVGQAASMGSLLLAAGQKGLRSRCQMPASWCISPRAASRARRQTLCCTPRNPKSQEAAQRDLHEAYRPAAAEDRRRAGARLFYDGGDGQGFRLGRQGNR